MIYNDDDDDMMIVIMMIDDSLCNVFANCKQLDDGWGEEKVDF